MSNEERIKRMKMKPDQPPEPGLVTDALCIALRYAVPPAIHPDHVARHNHGKFETITETKDNGTGPED